MEKKKWCVYKHTNINNGKVYIGITSDTPENRWANGLRYPANAHFTNAIKKYGWDGFSHEIVADGLTKDEASAIEIRLIKEFYATDRRFGYNIALGGVGRESVSDETREKMRLSHIGEKNHNFGKHKTEETIRKLSLANKKYWEEHPRPQGYKRSQVTIEKMRASRTGCTTAWKGGHHSQDTIAKMRTAQSKPVLCIETGSIYLNARIAASEIGTSYSSISCVCNKSKSRVTAGGYHWRFATDEEYALKTNNNTVEIPPGNPSYFKKVKCVETGEVFCSLAEAALHINRSKQTICGACKNSSRTAGGYHWEYV